jgi:hypothetical protein
MPIGQYSGYTGDTLIHLADGTRKYIRDLAPGDELQLHDSSIIKVAQTFTFEFDGFISLVAPGLTTTRYTIYHDFTTNNDTTPEEQHKPTLYYHGPLYNFFTDSYISRPIIVSGNPITSPLGIYDIGRNPDNCAFILLDKGNTGDNFIPTGIWEDPPGIITQRHPKPSAESN